MRPLSIVLIDDSPADAELIKLVVASSRLHGQVNHYLDGETALEHLSNPKSQLPDLILLDLNMPGMDGHDVLAAIRRDDRLRRLAVLILSSSEDATDVARVYDAHANAYVVKPLRSEGFHSIIDAIENFWFSVVKFPPTPSAAN